MNRVQKTRLILFMAVFSVFCCITHLTHSAAAGQKTVSLKACPKIIRSMALDSRQRLWIGTFGKGLWVKEGEEIRQFHDEKLQLPFPMINNLLVKDNLLYIATAGGGIHCLNTDEDKFLNLNQHHNYKQLHGLIAASSGQMMAGSVGNGLCVLKTGDWQPIAERQPTSISWINTMAEWNNHIWLGTSTGLYRFKYPEKKFKPEFAGLNRGINHLLEFKGDLYAGTTSRGVFICKPGKPPYQLSNIHGNVHFLIEFSDNLYSIGEENIYKITPNGAQKLAIEFDGAKCAAIDHEKNLLVGTLDGKIYKSTNGKTFSTYMQLTENGFEELTK